MNKKCVSDKYELTLLIQHNKCVEKWFNESLETRLCFPKPQTNEQSVLPGISVKKSETKISKKSPLSK